MLKTLKHNALQVLIALDQLLHCLAGLALFYKIYADETFSSFQYRRHVNGKSKIRNFINALFFWQKDHCRKSYKAERNDRQLPPEMREKF